ncbi:hypothetical protein DY000_02013585 [Brassica cretica]|uniref:Uncharacterized protein n=1 Tax=Brassica cretica TaxID=69181 RepID=A0ABQ7CNF9_BRACR|nr:hypothetical protein DY000_02013585 [Brassica cretica]
MEYFLVAINPTEGRKGKRKPPLGEYMRMSKLKAQEDANFLEPDLTEPDIQDMISNITKPETVQEVPLVPVEDSSLKKDELKSEPAEKNQASSEDIWPFIPEQGHNNLMIITIEDQFA